MELLLQWGLELIRTVQTAVSPPLTLIVRGITALGGEYIYMILIPVIYWCIDEKKGLKLGFIVFISIWVNLTLKYLFDQPRPFFAGYDPSVGLISERMGGLPSGHAQNSMVMLFVIASWINKKWAYISDAVLVYMISFSRIYLGVHFPSDIIAGWIVACIILYGYYLFSDSVEKILALYGYRAGMIATAALAFLMIIYLPGTALLAPGATILGLGLGYCLNKNYVGFTSAVPFGKEGSDRCFFYFTRLFLGFLGFALIYYMLGRYLPQDSANYKLYGFLQVALPAFWISYLCPLIFVRLKLA
jgi:membrane-associated phospholipid phosphatase